VLHTPTAQHPSLTLNAFIHVYMHEVKKKGGKITLSFTSPEKDFFLFMM